MADMPRGRGTFRVEHTNKRVSIETPGEFEQKNLARISTDTAMKEPRRCDYPNLCPPPRTLSEK
jgi:hypothetical protein